MIAEAAGQSGGAAAAAAADTGSNISKVCMINIHNSFITRADSRREMRGSFFFKFYLQSISINLQGVR